MQAPFPWFGGKSRIAGKVWDAQGDGSGRANKHRERLWLSPHCVGENATVQMVLP